jgi:hypothetical protein
MKAAVVVLALLLLLMGLVDDSDERRRLAGGKRPRCRFIFENAFEKGTTTNAYRDNRKLVRIIRMFMVMFGREKRERERERTKSVS